MNDGLWVERDGCGGDHNRPHSVWLGTSSLWRAITSDQADAIEADLALRGLAREALEREDGE